MEDLIPIIKAAIYCRVSTQEQAKEGFSIAAQKKTLTSYCRSKNWQVCRIYCDEGISGKSTNRPAFKELLADARSNLFTVALVWKINRFSRKNSDLLNTVEYLKENNINLISCSEQFDSSTPSGKLMLSMLGSIGEFERDTIVENIKFGMIERAQQGLFNGGTILGYDMLNGKLIVSVEEALTVCRIFNLYLSGHGYKSIQNILTLESKKTKNNYHFQISSIRRILKNPIYAGYITYNKTMKLNNRTVKCDSPVFAVGNHVSIVSKEDYDAVQEIINSRSQSYMRSNSYILSSILKCPVCGGKMTSHTINKRKIGEYYRYYICLNYKSHGNCICTSNSINADLIEDQVIGCLEYFIMQNKIAKDIYDNILKISRARNPEESTEVNTLEKKVSILDKTRCKYFKLFEDNLLDACVFSERLKLINDDIENITARINILKYNLSSDVGTISIDNFYDLLKNFKSLFQSLNSSTKKRILLSLIKEVCFTKEYGIKNIVLNLNILPESGMRYTDNNVKCNINS